MFDAGYQNKDKDKFKKKFDRFWETKMPTGSAEMPLFVRRAKTIKDNISESQFIAYASLNSDNSSFGLVCTAFMGKDGKMRHPATEKQKNENVRHARGYDEKYLCIYQKSSRFST